jgi:Uma2 family endonuclease
MIAEGAEFTADAFFALPNEKEYELIDGKLRRRKGGGWSSWVGGRLFNKVADHAHERHFGWAFPAGTGYHCFLDKPNQVLKPTVSFIRHGRFPGEELPWEYIQIAPDLAVEATHPDDLFFEIGERVEGYLRAGTPLIWVINPNLRVVQVYRGDGSGNRLHEGDNLTGEQVLPGFECAVAALFPPAPAGGAAASS